jgi:hypothetical protein
VTEPVVPDTTADEQEIGWGDDLDAVEGERENDERLVEDRPPHHDRD